MFGKKPHRQDFRIIARDGAGAVVLDASSAAFALPEAAVIALSVEFFDDPEPCEIHRAAVRSRALQELRESCPGGRETAVSALPERLRGIVPEAAQTVRVLEEVP